MKRFFLLASHLVTKHGEAFHLTTHLVVHLESYLDTLILVADKDEKCMARLKLSF